MTVGTLPRQRTKARRCWPDQSRLVLRLLGLLRAFSTKPDALLELLMRAAFIHLQAGKDPAACVCPQTQARPP
jgi:hypothetical protein